MASPAVNEVVMHFIARFRWNAVTASRREWEGGLKRGQTSWKPNEINALSGSFSSIYLAISQPLPRRANQFTNTVRVVVEGKETLSLFVSLTLAVVMTGRIWRFNSIEIAPLSHTIAQTGHKKETME